MSGNYFLDINSNELYEFIDDVTPGEITSKLKSVSIGKKPHYLDTQDNNIYICLEDGDVGDHVGSRVNGKAVLKTKKV